MNRLFRLKLTLKFYLFQTVNPMAFTPVLRLCLTLEVMLCRKIFKTSITRGTCTSQLKKKTHRKLNLLLFIRRALVLG